MSAKRAFSKNLNVFSFRSKFSHIKRNSLDEVGSRHLSFQQHCLYLMISTLLFYDIMQIQN